MVPTKRQRRCIALFFRVHCLQTVFANHCCIKIAYEVGVSCLFVFFTLHAFDGGEEKIVNLSLHIRLREHLAA